jgi:hypothetical protein
MGQYRRQIEADIRVAADEQTQMLRELALLLETPYETLSSNLPGGYLVLKANIHVTLAMTRLRLM